MTGMMETLDRSGDTKLMWDRNNPVEVETVRTAFDALRKKRYLAFRAEGREGERGTQIDRFDPNVERIIMVPPMVGG